MKSEGVGNDGGTHMCTERLLNPTTILPKYTKGWRTLWIPRVFIKGQAPGKLIKMLMKLLDITQDESLTLTLQTVSFLLSCCQGNHLFQAVNSKRRFSSFQLS